MSNFVLPIASIVVLALALSVRALRERLEKKDETFIGISDGILLSIEVPKNNEQGPVAAGMMFSALHGLLKGEEIAPTSSFEIVATSEGIRFYAFVSNSFSKYLKSQIYAQYPTAEIREVADYSKNVPSTGLFFTGTEIKLTKAYYYPIKTFPDFEVDPLAAITSAVGSLSEREQGWLQIIYKPIPDVWQKTGYDFVKTVREGLPPPKTNIPIETAKNAVVEVLGLLASIPISILTGGAQTPAVPVPVPLKTAPRLGAGQDAELKAIETKLQKLGFEVGIRIMGVGPSANASQTNLDNLVASLKQFSTAYLNSFAKAESPKTGSQYLDDYRIRAKTHDENTFVLNTEELASVFHLPSISVSTPSIAYIKAKKSEPPLDLPINVEPLIGQVAFRDQNVKFGIKKDDRRRHMYMIGTTGAGKTTLMRNMILQDIKNGEGVAVLDPHGDFYDYVLDRIPDNRLSDVVVLDPSDTQYPVAINMLELLDPAQKPLVASALVDVFKTRFAFSWGPRMEHLLRNTFLTLLEVPNTTLLSVIRMVTDRNYRKYITHSLNDPILIAFWDNEFEQISRNERMATEAIAPLQNRIGPFLSTPMIRNIIGQAKSTIKFNEIIDSGKILLVNLSKGKIGDDISNILGGMLISRLWFAALNRASIFEENRRDFFVYADEFQNFATITFATILSEARKFRLGLILGHQYISQLPIEVRDAIFGNVGTIISFRIGQQDAFTMAKEFKPIFEDADFTNMERFQIYLKLMIDLTQSRPFSARTLPAPNETFNSREKVIEYAHANYATNKALVEERIKKWSERQFSLEENRETKDVNRDNQLPVNRPGDNTRSSQPISGSIDVGSFKRRT